MRCRLSVRRAPHEVGIMADMGGVERREPPNATVLVEGSAETQLLARLFAHADIPFRVIHLDGNLGGALDRLLRELSADRELIMVFVESRQPPAEVMSAIARLSATPRPVLLLAAERESATGWPAALQNLPVVFADGDLEAIGKRLRLTIELLVSDYEETLAAQARRAERAQASVRNSRVAISPQRGAAAEMRGRAGRLAEDAAQTRRQLVADARDDLGSFLEQRFDALLVQHLGGRAPEVSSGTSKGADLAWLGRGWDVAIWVDALGSPSFNPVLVKYGHDENQKVELERSLFDLDLRFGIFIHDDGEPRWEVSNDAIVVSIGVQQLVRHSKRRFHSLMVETRDRLVRSQS